MKTCYYSQMVLIVFTTALSAEAEPLAEAIVKAKLAVCVQILPPMMSVYVWEGKIQKEPENLLLIKTLAEKYDELERFITGHHTYNVPEVVAIESSRVSGPYLAWMRESLGS